MAVRIYSLAKELSIDNKELVSICEKAGLRGKGSALASLDDDEVIKLKSFISERSVAVEKKGGEPSSLEAVRLEKPARSKAPIRDLTAKQRLMSKAKTEKEPVVEESPPPPPPPPPPPVAEAKPVVREPVVSDRPAPLSKEALKNVGRRGPMRDLSARDSRREPKKDGEPRRETKRRGPVINAAAMPEVKQPAKRQEPKEKVQKPDIALPQDAIKKVKYGTSAPLQQFTDTNKTKKDGKKAKPAHSQRSAEIAGIVGEVEQQAAGKGKGKSRGRGGPAEKDKEVGLGNIRQQRSRSRNRSVNVGGDDDHPRRRPSRYRRDRKNVVSTAAPRKEDVVLELPCTVRSFSEASGTSSGQILKTLMIDMQIAGVNINSQLDVEITELLVEQLGVSVEMRYPETLEDALITQFEEAVDDEAELQSRPPVITFLGHVDHGKTSLLDAIIGIDVVSGEAGGITQHIRAYSIEKNGQRISFVDTPGHEAFTAMRARGANVTDIAVLVVAADDGVMPQTEEAISHAKAAGVPIIVALNKIDLASANTEKVLQDLAQHELLPSEWGGEVEVVRTSAIAGDGLDSLLETILVTAELHEYKANPDRAAIATCLETEQESGRGVVAKTIVKNGTLKVGDVVVCGGTYGRVKALHDTLTNRKIEKAGPSMTVNLIGLDLAPEAGDTLYVMDDISKAREIAESRTDRSRSESLSGNTTMVSLEEFQARLESGSLSDDREELVKLNLIIRADVRGSIEAIMKELGKLEHPEVEINVLQASVGGVTRGDVTLAHASQAVVIGFNVVPDESARVLADDVNVEIRRYDIIYKISEDIKATLEGRLRPEKRDVETGSAMVLRTFTISRIGTIAGCRVMRGNIDRDSRIRVIRDNRVIGDYAIETLRREKDDTKDVRQGMECGIKLHGFNDIKEADTLEAYKVEEIARTL
ncbi:MAG: translation initiation factor IF-2 [Pirellulaceae bacterium]|nr:translation initiation factor IF-2 [Pirellulaceae bacterium]